MRVRGERRDVPSANWLRREIENLQGPRRRDRVYQQDLAKTSGLAQSSISAILSGRRIPDRETVDVLAKGLAVMASELRPGMTLSEQSAYQQAVLVSGLWAAGYNQFENESVVREFAEFVQVGYGELDAADRQHIKDMIESAVRTARLRREQAAE